MQTQNPFLDEFSKLTTAAIGLAQAAGEEAKVALKAQFDRLAAEMDFVRRDEFEAARAAISALREEVARLKGATGESARAPQEAG